MSLNARDEARDDVDVGTSSGQQQRDAQKRSSRRSSESEVFVPVGLPVGHVIIAHDIRFKRSSQSQSASSTPDLGNASPEWTEGSSSSQPEGFSSSSLLGTPLFRSRSHATGGRPVFGTGASRRRLGLTPEGTSRQASTPSMRHGRGQGSKSHDNSHSSSNNSNVEEDDQTSFVSLSDLIRKEDKVPPTLYEHHGDTDVVLDARGGDAAVGGKQAPNGATLGVQGVEDAVIAAKNGNSICLSKYLQDGGDVNAVSGLDDKHRWSLLHLAAGSVMMGGRQSSEKNKQRAEPDCNDGYATCVAELLAAGADPNVTSKVGGYTPLMCAALTGSKQCCLLLLRAGAQVDRKADDGKTAFHFAERTKQVGGGDRGAVDDVIAVLRDPPKKVPRSPTWVRATLAERSCLEPEDSVPSVQVRWRVPSQASLLPTVCGDVQRYYIKCWCHGKGREVIATKTSTVDVPRRDFCRNQVIDRGIALRKNLALPQPKSASTIVHGLQAGNHYTFTVSCKAEVEGALRQSPPSCKSKPLLIPESKDDHQWTFGGKMLSMVTGSTVPSPSGASAAGFAAAQAQVRRAQEQQPPSDVDQSRRTHLKSRSVSWAKDDDVGPAHGGMKLGEGSRDSDATPRHGFPRTMPSTVRQWDSRVDISGSPVRPRSMSLASATSRLPDTPTAGLSRLPSFRASLSGPIQSVDSTLISSPPLAQTGGRRQEGERHSFRGTQGVSPAALHSLEPRRRDGVVGEETTVSTVRSDRGSGYRTRDRNPSFEGCAVS